MSALRWIIIALSALGFAFCVLNAFGADLACFTQGCQIYSNYEFLGISFYVYGAMAFAALGILAFFTTRSAAAGWAFAALIATTLLADTAFLVYQYLFWPCASCMVVALLLGLIAILGIFYVPSLLRNKVFYAIIGLWAFFFTIIAMEIAREISLEPWVTYGSSDALVKVYVSPSCPACKELVAKITADPTLTRQSAFHVIAKDSAEERAIAHYLQRVQAGANDFDAFQRIFTDEPPKDVAPMTWQERLRLQSNTMSMARMGASSVPLVIAPGIVEKQLQSSTPTDSGAAPGLNSLQNFLNSPEGSTSGGFSAGCSVLNPTADCPDLQ